MTIKATRSKNKKFWGVKFFFERVRSMAKLDVANKKMDERSKKMGEKNE